MIRSNAGRAITTCGLIVTVIVARSLGQVPPEPSHSPVVTESSGSNDSSQEESIVGITPGAAAWFLPYYDPAPLTLSLEYLHWWFSGNSLPPLVTTSPIGTAPILGSPTTSVLFGNDEVDAAGRNGMRATLNARLSHWLDTDLEVEGHLILIGHGQRSGDYFAQSTGDPVLGRPFFNVDTMAEDYLPLAAPGSPFPDPVLGVDDPTLQLDLGRIQAETTSDLDAAGVVFGRYIVRRENISCRLLGGYRYIRYQEGLTLTQSQTFSDATDPDRFASVDVLDSFSTWSEFHGADLGIESHLQHRRLHIELLAKVGLGNVHQILDVDGATLIDKQDPVTPEFTEERFGFLTRPSNVGRFTADKFGAVPEFGITLSYPITRDCSITLGYTLLGLPNVLRTGDQIDRAIDPTQAVDRPAADLDGSVLWMQGINIGVEL